MFFSLIQPSGGRETQAAHEWARGPYSEHQWLWRMFRAPEGTPRDFLFRRWDVGGMPRFYVVSQREPRALSSAWRVQVRDYAPRLEVGMRLHFDLRANPVVMESRDGRRHDVVMHAKKELLRKHGLQRWQDWQGDGKPALYSLVRESCGAWLRARASQFGAEIDEESLSTDRYERHAENGRRLLFSTVDFSGELTVLDSVAFSTALQRGIGRAKAFGCGLMLVRRV
jgi:CRISPR system Cascade subunit CasE